jgi:Na+/proline symporter
VLASVSEFGMLTATTLAAAVVIAYTAVGGMWADSVTDLVQGIVVILGLVALTIVFAAAGGFADLHLVAVQAAQAVPAEEPRPLIESLAVPIFGTIAAQELTARVLAMRSVTLARNATAGAGLMYLAIGLLPVLMGLGAAKFLGSDADPEQVLSHLAQNLLAAAALHIVPGRARVRDPVDALGRAARGGLARGAQPGRAHARARSPSATSCASTASPWSCSA